MNMKKTLLAALLSITATSAMAEMDHSKMDHSKMDHSNMNHDDMDHSKMDHSMMSMEGMSDVGMPATGAKPDKVVHVVLADDMTIKFKKKYKLNQMMSFNL